MINVIATRPSTGETMEIKEQTDLLKFAHKTPYSFTTALEIGEITVTGEDENGAKYHMVRTKDTFGSTHWEKMEQKPRMISDIAQDIRRDWKKVYFGALPYLCAMEELSKIDDNYGHDTGTTCINYFLANAGTWKGDVARRVKAELKAMVK